MADVTKLGRHNRKTDVSGPSWTARPRARVVPGATNERTRCCYLDRTRDLAIGPATWVLAALTFAVVLAAVAVPQWQRWRERKDKEQKQSDLDRQAEDAIERTVGLVREVSAELGKKASYDQFALWPLANRIHTQRRVVEYFFAPGGVSPSIPYRLSACIQALDEAADGVEQAIDKKGPRAETRKALVRANGAATAARALDRLTRVLNEID